MYTALYRKWRPLTFDDVVSQPHITTTLSRQIADGKTAHAYLFTGSRGTGKTTCARIFAKAINCLDSKDGKPCLECEICKSADSSALSDIIEIDAASNTGVDDIRELRESTIYTPERCKYKVYIIDEVHMLSNQAFNALLKIMEEPPPHIKFILATTEVHKVPATIISRCQRFDFRRIKPEDISARLLYIANAEGFNLNVDASRLIARIADGAMRDALSLLDQCVAYSKNIDLNVVSEAAGIAGRDYLFDILEAIAEKNISLAIERTDELYSKSKDMSRLCDELLFQTRNLMLIKTIPEKRELLACLEHEADKLKSISEKMSLEDILSSLDILQECSQRMQKCVSKRTEFEMSLVRLCSPTVSSAPKKSVSSNEIAVLSEKILSLEKELNKLKKQSVTAPVKEAFSEPEPVKKPEPEETSAQIPQNVERKPLPEWDMILERLTEVNPGCAGALSGSKAMTQGNYLLISVKNKFFLGLFKKPENAQSLKECVLEVTGKSYSIRAKCEAEETNNSASDALEELIQRAKNADIPVDIN